MILFQLIRQRILDTYKQTWYSEINNSSRLQAYSIFNCNFELESYLNLDIDKKYKLALTRFVLPHIVYETGRSI